MTVSGVPAFGERPNLAKAGERWTGQDHEALVRDLAADITLDEVAEAHGRTVGAMRTRASLLVPVGVDFPTGAKARTEWLRARLSEGDYDWETPLSRAMTASQSFCSPADDRELRQAWETCTPLPDLSQRFRASETLIVRQLILLGLADSTMAVTDRLGFDPNGQVAARRNVALDDIAATVHVLVIRHEAELRHLSVHHSEESANEAVDDAIRSLNLTKCAVNITIASRVLDECTEKGNLDAQAASQPGQSSRA